MSGNVNLSVPVWHKANLTLEEASAYYGIGINTLRELTDRDECQKYILWVGRKRLIKREPFARYLETLYTI